MGLKNARMLITLAFLRKQQSTCTIPQKNPAKRHTDCVSIFLGVTIPLTKEDANMLRQFRNVLPSC